MGVKHRVLRDLTKDIEKNCKELNKKRIQVGVLEGEHQWLAGIHEYGCDIKVTDKMRAWLHYNGIHLKAKTTVIHIPERAFLKNGYEANIDKVMKKTVRLLKNVTAGVMEADELRTMTGTMLASLIKKYVSEGKFDEKDSKVTVGLKNGNFTVGRKNSSKPLVDTGEMIGGITYRVK